MPTYEYHCRTCQENFVLRMAMKDNREHVHCKQCQSSNVFRNYAGILTQTDKQRATIPDVPLPAGANSSHSCHSCRC